MVKRYIGDAQWTALDSDPKPTNAAVADTLTTTDTRRMFIHHGGSVWLEIGLGGTGGGGATGGGFSAGGSATKSGNAVSKTVTIAHGLPTIPDVYFALPVNEAARGDITYSVDGINITLTYPAPPAAGIGNLSYVWGAGYVAPGGGPATNTLTFNKITVPANQVDAETGLLYFKEIDASNNTLAAKQQIAGQIVEVEFL